MKKKGPSPKPGVARKPLDYYLGCFFFDEFSDRDSEGTFQIVVQARDAADAADRCRALLEKLRLRTTLFHQPCSIYIEGLVRLQGSFEEGLLVNYESTFATEPRASISCLIPEQEHPSEAYGWSPAPKRRKGQEKDESETIVPFIDFGGQGVLEQRAALRRPEPTRPAAPLEGEPAQRRPAKHETAAQREAEKAEKTRRAALARTMRELASASRGSARTKRRP